MIVIIMIRIFKTINDSNDGIDEDDGDEILLQLCGL